MRISNYIVVKYTNLPPNFKLESKPQNRKTVIQHIISYYKPLIFDMKPKQF